MSDASAQLPFDYVVVQEEDGGERRFSAEEFLTLGLHVRIRYILAGRLRFSRAGRGVDTDEALRALRERNI